MTVDAPRVGRRRVDPGAIVTVNLSASVLDDAKDVRLVATVPLGWTVVGTGGGAADPSADTVSWGAGDVQAGTRLSETMRLRAPGRSPTGLPVYDTIFRARLEHADGTLDTATARLLVAPQIVVEHLTFALVDDASHIPTYLPPDLSLGGIGRLELFRIRFQVRNADLVPTLLTARLQFRVSGAPDFADVPNGGPVAGVPFYLGTEWRPVAGGGGTLPGPAEEGIAASDLRERDRDDDMQAPVGGERLMQASSARPLRLAADAYTEIEFTVRSSLDLPFNQGFELRLVDGGQPIPGAVTAVVRSGSQPPLVLSPGQRDGIDVGPPVDSGRSNPRGMAGVEFPLVAPGVIAATWSGTGQLPIYRLAVAVPTTPLAQAPLAAPFTSPHVPSSSLVSDACAACHPSHTARSGYLLATDLPQETLCYTCHNAMRSGSNLDVQGQLATAPANVPGAREYYRHDVVSDTTLECSSCHNAHNATAAASIQTATGWTVAGAQSTVAGVVVTNGAAGTAPTYTFKDGTFGNQPTREYEICFQCHTGGAVPSNAGQTPSRYQLDKGTELNPANASYHPVEAAGKNGTTAMASSLLGSSPYKQWNFAVDSTIRCVNCHADSRPYAPAAGLPQLPGVLANPAAGGDLSPHASQYRGILIQPYRDRGLKSAGAAYAAPDFGLCYVCHAEAPFRNDSTGATNFDFHAKHVTDISGDGAGSSTDIDTPGAGQGNAICAECHFRIHGTALRTGTQGAFSRLVNFAPNVTASGGVISFTPKSGTAQGSCTMTCHGEPHTNAHY
jgi:predicted CXXCH cytochrome family protein